MPKDLPFLFGIYQMSILRRIQGMFDDDLGFPRHHLALEMLAFVAASCHGTTAKKGFMDKENMLETTILRILKLIFLPQNLMSKAVEHIKTR